MITIRRARKGELPRCIELIEQFLQEERVEGYENNFKRIDLDKEKMYNTLINRLNDPDFYIDIIKADEEIVGGLCAYIASPIFSSDRIAYDQLLYVDPNFNNLRAVITLIKQYVWWAEKQGAKLALLRTSTGFKTEAFTKLCTKLQFEPFETALARRL